MPVRSNKFSSGELHGPLPYGYNWTKKKYPKRVGKRLYLTKLAKADPLLLTANAIYMMLQERPSMVNKRKRVMKRK